ARAQFGEKYADEDREVSMGDEESGVGAEGRTNSQELCGGTHVGATGEIGMFVLTGEGASSAGVRRVEGLTGAAAFDYLRQQDHRLAETALALKARPEEVSARVTTMMDERRALEREVAELRKQLALAGGGGPAQAEVEEVSGVPFLAQSLSGVSGKDLRGLIDEHKARLGSGAVLLVADTGGKAAVAAGVTDDLTARISAVDLVRAAAEALGGKGGGGRADMAQAGGADATKAPEAIAAARAVLAG
ncbi:MAG: DHHA1 domain-containing protein, partial [Pseudomonadota bacterium]